MAAWRLGPVRGVGDWSPVFPTGCTTVEGLVPEMIQIYKLTEKEMRDCVGDRHKPALLECKMDQRSSGRLHAVEPHASAVVALHHFHDCGL